MGLLSGGVTLPESLYKTIWQQKKETFLNRKDIPSVALTQVRKVKVYRNLQQQTGENPAQNLSYLATPSSLDRLVYQHSTAQPLSYEKTFQDAASQGNAALFPRQDYSLTVRPEEVQSIDYSVAGADEYDFDALMLETRSILTKENHLNEVGEVEAGYRILDPQELEETVTTTYLGDDHLEALASSVFQYQGLDDEEDTLAPQPYTLHIIDEANYFFPELDVAANDNVELDDDTADKDEESEGNDQQDKQKRAA